MIILCIAGIIIFSPLEAQQFGGGYDSAASHMEGASVITDNTDHYTDGLILYGQGYFSRAQRAFMRSFRQTPGQAAAEYVYNCMLAQGEDLTAMRFYKANQGYMGSVKPVKPGFESLYVTAGERISAVGREAGDIHYADLGGTVRLLPGMRLWQSVNYLQQDGVKDNFRQIESFSSVQLYLGENWTVAPVFHYANVSFASQTQQIDSINEDTKDGKITWKSHLCARTDYTFPGNSEYCFAAIGVRKKIGSFTFEVQPALHFVTGKSSGTYRFETMGVVDSFYKNKYYGSTDYHGSGEGQLSDSSLSAAIYQLGAGATYRLPLRHEPVMLRAMIYYLQNGKSVSAMALSLYGLLQLKNAWWVHVIWETKGDLPCAFSQEGVYYNLDNKINCKTGVSLQLFPLKKFSPTITYQYETGIRLHDKAYLKYNSVYFTLRYSL